ncbi:hypothetical protein [Yoonia maritima]|uniref:hypothetical protein n=1 Tax=Yoonia maritima TaxID=1435347 RepID=UPI000D1109E9|nr:hypothetical protein [Yoonia maritima]
MQRMLLHMPLLIGAMLLAAHNARAEQTCIHRDAIIDRLARQFGEHPHAVRWADDHTMVELFVAPDTGSWTITSTRPGNLTCLVSAGQAFEYKYEKFAEFPSLL